MSSRPEVTSGFRAELTRVRAKAWPALDAGHARFAPAKRLKQNPHHRTLWLGSMKAVVLGASGLRVKYRYAATMIMRSASTVRKSICRGS
jgi:hypothetical protein